FAQLPWWPGATVPQACGPSRWRLMVASVDFRWAVSKRTSKQVDTLKGFRMQLHQDSLPQPKRSLSIVDECSDDFERKLGLADAVFSFAASPLIRILDQLHLLGGGMALRHRRKLPTCSSSRRSIFDQHQRSIPA